MTWTKQILRLSVALVVLRLALGVASISHAQRFVRPINSLPELIVSNPNDPHTNVFIPQGPTGPGLFYQWRKNDAAATNDNLSVLGSDWPGASGRWYKIPISGLSGDGISNPGTNDFAVVNTLADLRNIPGDLGIGMVYVRGHSLPGDWGRGFFSRRDDCSIPDDDAYSVHGNSGSTCWKRESDFPWAGIPVQYFGGTISINNINRATAFLASIGGGTAFITDGEWPVFPSTDGPILGHNNVTIAGSASALLVGDGTGTLVDWTNVVNGALIQVGISNVLNAVVIRGGTNILIGGNAISDVGDGVRQYGGDNVRIENNIFKDVTNGIRFTLDGAVKVTQGAVLGNTYSGVINEEVLEDAGAVGGYRMFENSLLRVSPSIVLQGNGPGSMMFGSNAPSYFGPPGTGGNVLWSYRNSALGDPLANSIDLVLEAPDYFAEWNVNLGSIGTEMNLTSTLGGIGPSISVEVFTNDVHFDLFNTNGALSFSILSGGVWKTRETTAPGLAANYGMWYASSADSKPHFIADDGTDYDLTGGGTGPAFSDLVWTNNAGVVQLVTRTNLINIGNDPTYDGDTGPSPFGGVIVLDESTGGTGVAIYNYPTTNTFNFIGFDFENFYPSTMDDTNHLPSVTGAFFASDLATDNTDAFYSTLGNFGILSYHEPQDSTGNLIIGGAVSVAGVITRNQSVSIGVKGVGEGGNISGQTNIGVVGSARYAVGAGQIVGGYFETAPNDYLTPPSLVSAALLADNRDRGVPVFIARTNGVERVTIDSGGKLVLRDPGSFYTNYMTLDLSGGEFSFTAIGSDLAHSWLFKEDTGFTVAELRNSGTLILNQGYTVETGSGGSIMYPGQTWQKVYEQAKDPTSAIAVQATWNRITVSSAQVVTNTPSVAVANGPVTMPAEDGLDAYIVGTSDANTVTLQDNGTLPGSQLELGAATRVLGKGDILHIHWILTDAVWYEVSFSNN